MVLAVHSIMFCVLNLLSETTTKDETTKFQRPIQSEKWQVTEILNIFIILYLSLTMRSISTPLITLPMVYVSAHADAVADKCMSSDKLAHMKCFLYLLYYTTLLVLKDCENVPVTQTAQFDWLGFPWWSIIIHNPLPCIVCTSCSCSWSLAMIKKQQQKDYELRFGELQKNQLLTQENQGF